MASVKTVKKKVAAKLFLVLNVYDDVVGEYPGETAEDAFRQATKDGDVEPGDGDEFKVVPKDAVVTLRVGKVDDFKLARV